MQSATTVVTVEQQNEIVELLQSARKLLIDYGSGRGNYKLNVEISNKIEKLMADTGVLPLTAHERKVKEALWAFDAGDGAPYRALRAEHEARVK
jgi:hypothetical protein